MNTHFLWKSFARRVLIALDKFAGCRRCCRFAIRRARVVVLHGGRDVVRVVRFRLIRT